MHTPGAGGGELAGGTGEAGAPEILNTDHEIFFEDF